MLLYFDSDKYFNKDKFFTFSHPQIRILARNGKKWERTKVISLSFHTLFFIFPHPQIKISGVLVKNRVGPPLFVYIFFYLLIQISKCIGKIWSWTPTEPVAYPFVTACVFGHSIRQCDLMEVDLNAMLLIYVAQKC